MLLKDYSGDYGLKVTKDGVAWARVFTAQVFRMDAWRMLQCRLDEDVVKCIV